MSETTKKIQQQIFDGSGGDWGIAPEKREWNPPVKVSTPVSRQPQPLVAHDAQTVERFTLGGYSMMVASDIARDDDGSVQPETGPCALHDHFGSGECPDCEVRRKLAEADARLSTLQDHSACKAQVETWIAKAEAAESSLSALREELRVTDELLKYRQEVLDAIPECPVHGSCVPHALDWIASAIGEGVALSALRAAVSEYLEAKATCDAADSADEEHTWEHVREGELEALEALRALIQQRGA